MHQKFAVTVATGYWAFPPVEKSQLTNLAGLSQLVFNLDKVLGVTNDTALVQRTGAELKLWLDQ